MEGLIPMVYKAMKKNRIRRQYSNLPSSATTSAASRTNYNIADFYPDPSQISYAYVPPPASNDRHLQLQRRIFNANGTSATLQESSTTNMSQGHLQHRRHQSLSGGDHNKYGAASFKGFSSQFPSVEADSPPPKQLARFGRHRRMFSCMSCVS